MKIPKEIFDFDSFFSRCGISIKKFLSALFNHSFGGVLFHKNHFPAPEKILIKSSKTIRRKAFPNIKDKCFSKGELCENKRKKH